MEAVSNGRQKQGDRDNDGVDDSVDAFPDDWIQTLTGCPMIGT